MGRVVFILIGCLCFGLPACEEAAEAERKREMQAAAESLVQAERDFAARVAARGIPQGFLAALSPHGVVFDPTPVNGHQQFQNTDTNSSGKLIWEPQCAEVAASLDLGYTTGPWEYFPDKDTEPPTAFGDYLSIWKRSASGEWELMLDLGISREHAEPASGLETYVATIGRGVRSFSVRDVREIDSVFAEQVRRAGFGFYDSVGTDNIRLLRDNTLRIVGKDSLQKVNLPTYRSTATGAAVSEQGDLGYVYGVAAGNVRGADGRFVPGEGGYVRVWRLEGSELKLAVEVMSMRPSE